MPEVPLAPAPLVRRRQSRTLKSYHESDSETEEGVGIRDKKFGSRARITPTRNGHHCCTQQ